MREPIPLTAGPRGRDLDSAKPREVLAAAGVALARGRLDGLFRRGDHRA